MVKRLGVIGFFVIATVTWVTYFPAIGTTLYLDDWGFVERAVRLNARDYLIHFLDPRLQVVQYRPVQGIQFLLEYHLFNANFAGYHVVQILLHTANCLLLSTSVLEFSRNHRLALVSGLLNTAIPAVAYAVNWVGVPDPLMVFLYLGAMWSWANYLRHGTRLSYLASLGAFVLSLLSKETGASLPVALFLMELLLGRRHARIVDLLLRYVPFALILAPYAMIEVYIQSRGWFVNSLGYKISIHSLRNLIDYLSIMVFPWQTYSWINYALLLIAILLLTYVMLKKRDLRIIFLVLFALLTVAPVIAFPKEYYFNFRWLYLPIMVSPILAACLLEVGRKWLGQGRRVLASLCVTVTAMMLANSSGTTQVIADYAEKARQARVPFRDISSLHAAFPDDTYLYFLNPPAVIVVGELAGMFALHYGAGINLGSIYGASRANLRDHNVAYTYYFDETGRPVEVAVEKNAPTQSSPPPPIDFAVPIRLEGYEIARTTVKRGEAMVLLLYWRATGHIDKDYTVFVHLVDQNRQVVSGFDSKPRDGKEQTSSWGVNQFIVDARVIPITDAVPAGKNYTLEVGLYYLPTLERLHLIDESGRISIDALLIGPFEVEE